MVPPLDGRPKREDQDLRASVIGLPGLTIGTFSIVGQEVPVKEERITPLRERMIEDMRILGIAGKTRQALIRGVRDFATFLKRSPGTATPEELRAYQLHLTDAGVSAPTFHVRIIPLRGSR